MKHQHTVSSQLALIVLLPLKNTYILLEKMQLAESFTTLKMP